MNLGLKTLSDIVTFTKYAKYVSEIQRRETWDEIVDRYETMLMKKYPSLKEAIIESAKFIREKKVLPSMRALQFAGEAGEVNNARLFNCSYAPVNHPAVFSEAMFLLLSGCGFGYSVQKHHVAQLPSIKRQEKIKYRNYLIDDSIIGWSEAIRVLMKYYFTGGNKPEFDFRSIRPKGARLVTAGGKAPGPEPLKLCLAHIDAIMERKADGEQLTPIECHDILCHIANSVLAGGIRRSAMIAFFSMDDEEMLTCKYGNWWELNEQRGRANNSAVLVRGEVFAAEFFQLWERIKASGSGEPGMYWTNDREILSNPCVEISLRPFSFCNLCEINGDDIESLEDLNDRVAVAAFFGTLQAGFTDYHYLRPIWKETTERDALLGIGITGIGSNKVMQYDLSIPANTAINVNRHISEIIGINEAARLTCIKPSGTTSLVLGTSSGVHAWHDEFYLRTMRFGKDEEIAKYLMKNHPDLCEDDILRPHDTLCVRIPVKAPEGAILRTESPIDTLERVKALNEKWIKPGHIEGANTHNVSATISIKENEWKDVGNWMWTNREFYNGVSVLPFDGHTYVQAPFESISEEEYNRRTALLHSLDLTKVIETDDKVDFGSVAACAGGACETNI